MLFNFYIHYYFIIIERTYNRRMYNIEHRMFLKITQCIYEKIIYVVEIKQTFIIIKLYQAGKRASMYHIYI